ncbi:MAG: RCC1 domain-containing protein [Gemmatimonadales bacterium]
MTTGSAAYCWGYNVFGQLGKGTSTGPEICPGGEPCSTRPVKVVGGLAFGRISAGSNHSCGVNGSNVAYCWGLNDSGELGINTSEGPETCAGVSDCSTRPVRVVGGLSFRGVTAGGGYTCGATTADVAFCWGTNNLGQLGDGTTILRLRPVPVAGGLAFRQVNAGGFHSCGVNRTYVAYCWGENDRGQLGDGTTINRRQPVAVAPPVN